jgi:hypothetical protein
MKNRLQDISFSLVIVKESRQCKPSRQARKKMARLGRPKPEKASADRKFPDD